jgi:hypothetical protein
MCTAARSSSRVDALCPEDEDAAGGVVGHGVLDRIFQSLMRESTISKQGATHSVAASTSSALTPGLAVFLSMKAISPSARGWIRL